VAGLFWASVVPCPTSAAQLELNADDWTLQAATDAAGSRRNHESILRAAVLSPFHERDLDRSIRVLGSSRTRAILNESARVGAHFAGCQVILARIDASEGKFEDAYRRLAELQKSAPHWRRKLVGDYLRLALTYAPAKEFEGVLADLGPLASLNDLRTARDQRGISPSAINLLNLHREIIARSDHSIADIELWGSFARAQNQPTLALEDCTSAFSALRTKPRGEHESVLETCAEIVAEFAPADEAQRLLDTYSLSRDVQSTRVVDAWAESYLRHGDTDRFLIRAQESPSPTAVLWRKIALIRRDRHEPSLDAWKKAWELAPDDRSTLKGLWMELFAGDDEPPLDAMASAMIRNSQPFLATTLDVASDLFRKQRPAAGRHLARWLSERFPNDSSLQESIVAVLESNRELELGLVVAERWHTLAPRSVAAILARGEHLYQSGKRAEALRVWETLPTAIRPAHAGWSKLAEILGEHADIDRSLWPLASDAMRKAIDASPRPEYLHRYARFALTRLDYAVAFATFERLLARPYRTQEAALRDDARSRMVEVLRRSGVPNRAEVRARALAHAERAIMRGNAFEARSAARFVVELHRDQTIDNPSLSALERVHRRFPHDEATTLLLAQTLRQLGQPQRTQELLEELEKQNQDISPATRQALARTQAETFADLAQFDEAISVIAASDSPTRLTSLLAVAARCRQIGEKKCAFQALARAVEIYPHSSAARLEHAELLLFSDPEKVPAQAFAVLVPKVAADLSPVQAERAIELALASADLKEHLHLMGLILQQKTDSAAVRSAWLAGLEHFAWRFAQESAVWLHSLDAENRERLSVGIVDLWQSDQIGQRERLAALAPLLLPHLDVHSLARALAREPALGFEPAPVRERMHRARADLIGAALQIHGHELAASLQQETSAKNSPTILRLLLAFDALSAERTPLHVIQQAFSPPFDDANLALSCLILSLDPKLAAQIPSRLLVQAAQESPSAQTRRICVVAQRLQISRALTELSSLVASADEWQAASAIAGYSSESDVNSSGTATFIHAVAKAFFERKDSAAIVAARALGWSIPGASPPYATEIVLTDFLGNWQSALESLALQRWIAGAPNLREEVEGKLLHTLRSPPLRRDPTIVRKGLWSCRHEGQSAPLCRNLARLFGATANDSEAAMRLHR
jgi:tetratricopeptide (TPR) repeat protein